MIDWIVAEWIATRVAGDGGDWRQDSVISEIDLRPLAADAQQRVSAYTGLTPSRPIPPPEGIGRREWVAANLASTRALMDPVMQRAQKSLGKLGTAAELTSGFAVSTEVGVLVGYLGQRVLGQYELVLLDEVANGKPPRLLFVLPNLARAVRAFGADETRVRHMGDAARGHARGSVWRRRVVAAVPREPRARAARERRAAARRRGSAEAAEPRGAAARRLGDSQRRRDRGGRQ